MSYAICHRLLTLCICVLAGASWADRLAIEMMASPPLDREDTITKSEFMSIARALASERVGIDLNIDHSGAVRGFSLLADDAGYEFSGLSWQAELVGAWGDRRGRGWITPAGGLTLPYLSDGEILYHLSNAPNDPAFQVDIHHVNEQNRIVFLEPVTIGERVRDIAANDLYDVLDSDHPEIFMWSQSQDGMTAMNCFVFSSPDWRRVLDDPSHKNEVRLIATVSGFWSDDNEASRDFSVRIYISDASSDLESVEGLFSDFYDLSSAESVVVVDKRDPTGTSSTRYDTAELPDLWALADFIAERNWPRASGGRASLERRDELIDVPDESSEGFPWTWPAVGVGVICLVAAGVVLIGRKAA